MTSDRVASRSFSAADQEAFAALSGDTNPMHMDPIAARRTQPGACVVHGVHLFLWALEMLASDGDALAGLTGAKTQFKTFTWLDQDVVLSRPKPNGIELSVDGVSVLRSTLRFNSPPRPRQLPGDLRDVPLTLHEPAFAEMEGQVGILRHASDPRPMFPALCASFGAKMIAEIALTSSVVGMVVPGLHSIFAELDIDFDKASGEGLRFRCERADERFRAVSLRVEGACIAGSVFAFERQPPAVAPPMDEVLKAVEAREFAGRRALVVGGSRGIGAVTAKILAAGGAEVLFTYSAGRDDAEKVRDDISHTTGCHMVQMRQFTVGDDAARLASLGPFTHVYYFPTPRIGSSKGGYDRAKYEAFEAVYVEGFKSLVVALMASHPASNPFFFYPSSVFVTEQPKGMAEYVMAKTAGEMLCTELARDRGLSIHIARLPRIATDQTAAIPPVPAADALEVMLPILRQKGTV